MAETAEKPQRHRPAHPTALPDREEQPENSRKRRERCLQAAVVAAEAALERPGVLLGPEEV